MKLEDMTVLVIDCQATGSSPDQAHLIEFGWAPFRVSSPGDPGDLNPDTRLIGTDESITLPHRVQELTGISREMLEEGDPLLEVERAFLQQADRTDRVLAHYAQYEQRFLKAETALRHPDRYHQQQFICSHEIATRLFPDLPRRGLRAMAGYFGYTVPEVKRVGPHIRATALIWQRLVRILRETEDVCTIEELESWLEQTSGQRSGDGYAYPISRERRLSLPEEPGIYRMVDREDRILYIGKATSLKARVNSYFQAGSQLSNRKLELVSRAKDVECEPVPTPLEAALLENDRIKKHRPPYNEKLVGGDRTVVYTDETLRDFRPKRSETHRIGPFSRPDRIEALGCLFQFIRNKSPSGPLPASRRLRSLVSEPDFSEGLQVFRLRHGLAGRSSAHLPIPVLISLGQTLWFQKQYLRTNENNDENVRSEKEDRTGAETLRHDTEERTNAADQLHADEVADRIESILRRGARDVRRARWYEELANSAMRWQPPALSGRWRRIVLQHGEVIDRSTTSSKPDLSRPDPADHNTPLPSSVAVFDRLRVFTTALKQAIKRDACPSLRTLVGPIKYPSDLETILWWI